EATDTCAKWRMATSEFRYAAELALSDGEVIKFDNIDCMVRDAVAHSLKDKAAAWFVMDSEGRQWLDARQALLVKSVSIPGPMGSGILAVRDSAVAGIWLAASRGECCGLRTCGGSRDQF